MAAFPERTPLNEPFKDATKTQLFQLRVRLEECLQVLDQKEDRSAMSNFLRLYGKELLFSAHAIGSDVAKKMEIFIQHCTDYANGHGKEEMWQQMLAELKDHLQG